MAAKKDVAIKILVEVARVLLGATFVFSGFVKAVDPYGTAYKIEDYLSSFDLSSFASLALPASVFLCIMEFLMGAFMLFGIYRRWNSRLVLLTMLFMTPLTLYLAIANPVEDCGCFGDALVISNWATFYKNIVLLACSIFVIIYRERISNFFTGKTYWLAFLYIIIFISLFVFRNYIYDPLFDFRPYKIGANIPALMQAEDGKGRQEENLFIYSKDGVEKEFTEDNYPWEDSTWVFVKMDTKIISEGEKPLIKDFTINRLYFDQGKTVLLNTEDITTNVLSDSNYVFLMISPSLSSIKTAHLSQFEDVQNYALDYHYKFYCLTASGPDDIAAWANENTIDFDFCNTDERTLKTIIRSNPGLLLLKDGVIINKWADIDVPGEEDLTTPLDQLPYSQQINVGEEDKKNILLISALFILPLLGLKGFDLLFFRRKKKKIEQDLEKNN
ncbi:MAG: DoxX family protein [Dysgonomonas sp.]